MQAFSKINFSSTITEISPWSFYGCNFVKLEIPETITKINIRGFANCTALQEVTIHNPNCVFDGIGQADASGGKDPFNGSQQSLVVKGHSNSTAQAYAKAKGYKFVSIDAATTLLLMRLLLLNRHVPKKVLLPRCATPAVS